MYSPFHIFSTSLRGIGGELMLELIKLAMLDWLVVAVAPPMIGVMVD